MNTKNFYVAKTYPREIASPTIVENFDDEATAKAYADLMSRAKNQTYVVFEVIAAYNIEAQITAD